MNNFTPKTELLYQKSKPIDQLNLIDGIYLMVDEQKKAATGTVEDQLAMAAARRQQMELDQAAERTKENEPVVSGSSPGMDQSKKRCVTAATHTVTSSIVAELSCCCCFLSCADPIRRIWMLDRSALKRQQPTPRTCLLALTRC